VNTVLKMLLKLTVKSAEVKFTRKRQTRSRHYSNQYVCLKLESSGFYQYNRVRLFCKLQVAMSPT